MVDGHTGTTVLAPVMGQTPSSAVDTEESVRKPSTTILREDSSQIQEEGDSSRRPSWSIHYDCTDQAPYTNPTDDNMMTSSSLLHIPSNNPSHDLADFLRHTGPSAPHRRPSKAEQRPPVVTAPQKALNFFGLGPKRSKLTHDQYNGVLRDEGGLLIPIPQGVEQKQTSTGKKYLALQPKGPPVVPTPTPVLGTDILDSQVSIQFADEMHQSHVWTNHAEGRPQASPRPTTPQRSGSKYLAEDGGIRMVMPSSSPIRPPASNPPTPQPYSAVSTLSESYISDLDEHPAKRSFDAARALSGHVEEHPAKRSFDAARALSSHPVNPLRPSPSFTALPKMQSPSPLKMPVAKKDIEIKHPSPRRFASHTVLLQRASSIASSLNPRSVSDSPGPPPPRSPLRLRRDPRTIENVIACHTTSTGRSTPRLAPSVHSMDDFHEHEDLMKPMVITDCTGPIKRPRSRGKSGVSHPAYPSSRKEREARARARKSREQRIQPSQPVTATVDESSAMPHRRLRKARPHISIPDLRPSPLVTRASSNSSSSVVRKTFTEYTRTPVSPVPSQGSLASPGGKTGYTPVSPTTSTENAESGMALSPVMLVAEEIPVAKARSTPKPARLVLRDGKGYSARPRSASLSRTALKRRSRTGNTSGSQSSESHTPARSRSPAAARLSKEEAPPLPSPPPNRALPPTPPASGSEKTSRNKLVDNNKKILPHLPQFDTSSLSPTSSTRIEHIITQAQAQKRPATANSKASRIDARLAEVERQNALLSAALMAVLKTNGALNAPRVHGHQQASSGSTVTAEEKPMTPPAWQTRIARRSAASHAASSSNGSALEMYMSTRRGEQGVAV